MRSAARARAPKTPCIHPAEQVNRGRYIASGRSAIRVEQCQICGAVLKRKRSRWKSRRDRLSTIVRELDQHRRVRGRGRQYAHWEAEREKAQRARLERLKDPAGRLLDALKECEARAKALPVELQNDDRAWKYHPIARRYRRLMRQWWTLSNAAIVDVRGELPKTSILFTWNSPPANAGHAPSVSTGRVSLCRKLNKLIDRAVKIDDRYGRERYVITGPNIAFQFRLFEAGAVAVAAARALESIID